MTRKIDFINGNTKKCLMAMVLPMIAAMFLNMAYNLVDSLWIGNLLGETAYAALTNSTPLILLLTSVAMGATNGISILLSQAIGSKDNKKIESLIATSFAVAIIFSLILTAIFELSLPAILQIMNTPTETYEMAYNYLSIYLLGYLAVYLFLYFTAVLRSFGKHITRKDERVRDVSFCLKKGEILGFSGLVGAGRTELMEAIFGASPVKSGEMYLYGKKLHIKSTYQAVKEGIVLVTENRRETGFSPYHSIKQNLVQAKGLKEAKLNGITGLIHEKQEQAVAREQAEAMQVKCASLSQIITELSGGNQQKVILGRWMASDPQLIIFDEPTKGIDVGTKSEIYKLMRKLAEQGKGVLVVSSEMPELLSTCDRIIVMNDGRNRGEFDNADATEEELVRVATMA